MSPKEAEIICGAVEDADTWGLGRISLAKERIIDAGYVWTPLCEQFIFEKFVNPS